MRHAPHDAGEPYAERGAHIGRRPGPRSGDATSNRHHAGEGAEVPYALLDRKYTFTYDAVPLEMVLRQYQETTQIPLDVRWEAIHAAGVDRDTPVRVRLNNRRASKALTVILSAVETGGSGLHYSYEGNRVEVTSYTDYAARNTVTLEYDLRPLAVPDYESVVDLVAETISGDTWATMGARDAVKLKGDRLTLTETREKQAYVQGVLQQLWEMKHRDPPDDRPRGGVDYTTPPCGPK